jgi:hypothetical protein
MDRTSTAPIPGYRVSTVTRGYAKSGSLSRDNTERENPPPKTKAAMAIIMVTGRFIQNRIKAFMAFPYFKSGRVKV